MGKSSGHNVRVSPPQTVVMDSNLSFQRLEYLKSASADCELPASSASPFTSNPVQRAGAEGFFIFFIRVSASVIGPNFLLQFSSPSARLPALACCSLVWNHPAGRQREEELRPVLWIILYIILLLWIIALHSCWERTEPIPRFTVLLRGFTAWVLSGWGVQVSCRY